MSQPQIIVALDVPQSADIAPIVDVLPGDISFYKVGLELFCAEGPAVLSPLKERNARIFLDLKLHDIPRTVANAVRSAAAHGVELLTVHAIGGTAMLKAAADAAGEFGVDRPKLIAVTTLTSLDQTDLTDLGISRDLQDQAMMLTKLALDAGIDGVVTSVHEAGALRKHFGPEPLLVTPGIRLPGGNVGDQKRVATPATAVAAGATHLVVGRAILEAENPHQAALDVLQDMGRL